MGPVERLRKYTIGLRLFSLGTRVVGVAGALVLSACEPKVADVVGNYSRTDGNITERLALRADSTFVQKVGYGDGGVYEDKGTWRLQSRRVELSTGYLTRDVFKNALISPPARSSGVSYIFTGESLEHAPDYVLRKD